MHTSPLPDFPHTPDDALAVVHSPQDVHDRFDMRATAWDILLRERGRRMNHLVIGSLMAAARRAHVRVVADAACIQVHRALAARPLPATAFMPATPVPFADDVDPGYGGAA